MAGFLDGLVGVSSLQPQDFRVIHDNYCVVHDHSDKHYHSYKGEDRDVDLRDQHCRDNTYCRHRYSREDYDRVYPALEDCRNNKVRYHDCDNQRAYELNKVLGHVFLFTAEVYANSFRKCQAVHDFPHPCVALAGRYVAHPARNNHSALAFNPLNLRRAVAP